MKLEKAPTGYILKPDNRGPRELIGWVLTVIGLLALLFALTVVIK